MAIVSAPFRKLPVKKYYRIAKRPKKISKHIQENNIDKKQKKLYDDCLSIKIYDEQPVDYNV